MSDESNTGEPHVTASEGADANGESHSRAAGAGFFARVRSIVSNNVIEVVTIGIAAVVLAAALIPSPYSVERPGPVVDVLGTVEVEGEELPVLFVEGESGEPDEGELNLLTVYISGTPQAPLKWLALVPALFDRSQSIRPTENFFPEGITAEQRELVTEHQMDESQLQAASAAFRELGLEVGVSLSVDDVAKESPASGKLATGDELASVNGVALESFDQLTTAVGEAAGPVVIGYVRDGVQGEASVTPQPGSPGEPPRLGITVASAYELPHDVEISVPDIGGPSAGLVFGLAVMDRLGESPNLAGLTVSGTGTLNGDGKVGPIGGLTQKAWAASRVESDLFLMPLANCADVSGFPSGLQVAPVATLGEAAAAIDAAAAGDPVPGLERCDTSE